MRDIDGIENLVREKICPICQKRFAYYPHWHHWKARANGSSLECVCSYTCMRKIERQEAEERRLAFERAERAKQNPNPAKPPKRKSIVKLQAELSKCEIRLMRMQAEEDAMRRDGTWKCMPYIERTRIVKRKYHCKRRIKALSEELVFAEKEDRK